MPTQPSPPDDRSVPAVPPARLLPYQQAENRRPQAHLDALQVFRHHRSEASFRRRDHGGLSGHEIPRAEGYAGSGDQYCCGFGVIISDHCGEFGMIIMRLFHSGEYGCTCGLPIGVMITDSFAGNLLPVGRDDACIDTVDTCSGHQAKNGRICYGFVRYHGSLLKIVLPVYRAPMAKDNSSTESVPHPSRWLDALDDAAALDVMATDQLAAAAAVGLLLIVLLLLPPLFLTGFRPAPKAGSFMLARVHRHASGCRMVSS